MADLLVASVFAGHPNDRLWYGLHRRFLQSLGSYDHAVYLNHADTDIFRDSIIIGHNLEKQEGSMEHFEGLKAIARYCKSHDYKYYLILDSDAFPINPDWLSILTSALDRHNKQIAAPARIENLDLFPHPLVVFTRDAGLLEFDYVREANLLGQETCDIHCTAPKKAWLPLLKSNRVSIHPTLATIYSDLFYHHGAGSRGFIMRAVHIAGYYDHYIDRYFDAATIFDQLMANPFSFIESIR
jgi:hypothetical protein